MKPEGDTIIMSFVEMESDWREHWNIACTKFKTMNITELFNNQWLCLFLMSSMRAYFFDPKPKNKSILWKDYLEPINPEEGE